MDEGPRNARPEESAFWISAFAGVARQAGHMNTIKQRERFITRSAR